MKVTRSLPFSLIAAAVLVGGSDLACGSDTSSPTQVNGYGGSAQGGSGGAGAGAGVGGSGAGSGVGGAFTVDASGGAGGGIQPDSGCAVGEVAGRLIPANLLFIVDRSGSMNCNLPADGQTSADCEAFPQKRDQTKPSKWETLLPAFKGAIDALQTNGNASVGLSMFPAIGTQEIPVTDTDCTAWKRADDPDPDPALEPVADLDVAPLNDTHNTALDTFLDGVTRQGKTPLAGATILGYRYLQNRITTGQLVGNYFLVLVTDGFDTCGPEFLPDLYRSPGGYVTNAGLLGIRTFVIGVQGSENARGLLSEIAYLGGTARTTTCSHSPTGTVDPADVCHFDMTTSTNFAADLTAALNAINQTVLSCELDVPQGQNVDPMRVNVEVSNPGGQYNTIGKDDRSGCDTANGWQYKPGDPTKIQLCGSACTQAKTPGASLRIVLGCVSVPA